MTSYSENTKNSVISRLVEDWWTNSTERIFQSAFASILCDQGYRVIHVTRHCGMELGRDVLAVNPEGKLCCYQLKTCRGPRVSLSQWKSEISEQISDLVGNAITHPSVGTIIDHQPFLVVNGGLEEEVQVALEQRNQTFRNRFGREVKIIVLGDLISMSNSTGDPLWQITLDAFRELINFTTSDGHSNLDKDRFSSLLEGTREHKEQRKLEKSKALRRITFLPIVTSLAIRNHSEVQNWVAEIEAWMMCWSYVHSLQLESKIQFKATASTKHLITLQIENALKGLRDEVIANSDLFQTGFDHAYGLLRNRSTWVYAMLSILSLRCRENGSVDDELENLIMSNTAKHHLMPLLWGEAAIPQILAISWIRMIADASVRSESILLELLRGILSSNSKSRSASLASPYIGPDQFYKLNRQSLSDIERFGTSGYSWYLQYVVDLLVDLNWRDFLSSNWFEISAIKSESFTPDCESDFFVWKTKSGTTDTTFFDHPQSWSKLKRDYQDLSIDDVCPEFQKSPSLGLLFLVVFPHRAKRSLLKAISTGVWKLRNINS